jgi:hypothetical protein
MPFAYHIQHHEISQTIIWDYGLRWNPDPMIGMIGPDWTMIEPHIVSTHKIGIDHSELESIAMIGDDHS